MSSLSDINAEAVRSYIIQKGGKVLNQELVNNFKHWLTDPVHKDESRRKFKEIVNQVAVVIREENGQKCLILRKHAKHSASSSTSSDIFPSTFPSSPSTSECSFFSNIGSLSPDIPLSYTPVYQDKRTISPISGKTPPPYRDPPPPPPSQLLRQWSEPAVSPNVPNVPARRKSLDKLIDNDSSNSEDYKKKVLVPSKVENRVRSDECGGSHHVVDGAGNAAENREKTTEAKPEDTERKISVKECMQKFNEMASEQTVPNLPKWQQPIASRKRLEKVAAEKEEDSSSVHSYDPKLREWLVRASQGNYQELAKLASENPKFPRYKDPATGYTALHWGAKHGNKDIIKLIAGTYNLDVNVRSNGGYTPLHIAMQHGHIDVYNLLVQVYGADQNIRDWSGRKPRQYQPDKGTSISTDTLRKIKAQKKHSEKESGFLRIGSLNVRVKKTTEAFSNFLGVGQSSTDKLHKNWGSADNIEDYTKMPPPKSTIKKRKSKNTIDFSIRKSPSSSPKVRSKKNVPTAVASNADRSDSDSDTAFGFDSNWHRNT